MLFAKKQVINVSGASCEKLTELACFAFSVFLQSETVGCALVYLRKDARVFADIGRANINKRLQDNEITGFKLAH